MQIAPRALLLLPLLALPAAALQDTSATYRVVFDATWSAATHPEAYPLGAHFSPLVGGTHDARVSFWQPGGIASPGIETMAETGLQFPLGTEVQEALNAGTAHERILGTIVLSSPGKTSITTFTATEDHPLLTLVTMIAPSPDWFVGVHDLPLLVNGEWADELVVELLAYDAGTDSGPAFTSPNQNTSPREPIALMTDGPFFGDDPLGTFTLRRIESTLVYGCGPNPSGSLAVTAGRPRIGTTLQVALDDPSGTLVTPAATFLALSTRPGAAFPCGTLVPGWGLGAVGTPGELLVQPPLVVMTGAPYAGSPVPFDLAIPDDASLVSRAFYVQGLFIDPTKRRGLTDALELFVGP